MDVVDKRSRPIGRRVLFGAIGFGVGPTLLSLTVKASERGPLLLFVALVAGSVVAGALVVVANRRSALVPALAGMAMGVAVLVLVAVAVTIQYARSMPAGF